MSCLFKYALAFSWWKCISCINYFLHAVHGFEQLSYTTPESDALQGINFRPNLKGTGQAANIGIITGTIDLEEDTASKYILFTLSHFIKPFTHHSYVRHLEF